MESEISHRHHHHHRHPPLLIGAQLLHQSFHLHEWAMNNPPSPLPATASPPPPPPSSAPPDDHMQDKPRCRWSFHVSAVVSPSSAAREVSDAIGAVEFDPTDRLLATGGIARKIRVYDLGTLLPDAGDSGPTFWSEHSAAFRLCICTPAKLSSLKWRPDSGGGVIAAGDYDGVVTEYDVERSVAVFERDEHAGRRVWSVDYSAQGRLGASGSDDGTVQLWDARCGSGRCAAVARAGGAICSVEFDPEGGPWLAAGSSDRHAYVYDVRAVDAGPVAALGGHGRAVTYVRFLSGGGRRVVSSGTDGSHRLWEWEEGRQVRAYLGHVNSRSFVGMAVWGGAGLIGSGSESNEVFVYDLRWGEPIWVQGFGPRSEEGRGFVGAVNWRQGVGNGEGALAAAGSDGVLQVFVARRTATTTTESD